MTEAELQAEVIRLCIEHGIWYFHSTDPILDLGKGFPDLVLVGSDGVAFVELKSAAGRLGDTQTVWMYKILAAGHRHEVWRPADLHSGLIEAFLSNL